MHIRTRTITHTRNCTRAYIRKFITQLHTTQQVVSKPVPAIEAPARDYLADIMRAQQPPEFDAQERHAAADVERRFKDRRLKVCGTAAELQHGSVWLGEADDKKRLRDQLVLCVLACVCAFIRT